MNATPPTSSDARREHIKTVLHSALTHRTRVRRAMRLGGAAAVVMCAVAAAWMAAARTSTTGPALPAFANQEAPGRRSLPIVREIAVGTIRVEVLGNLTRAQLASRGVDIVSDEEAASIVEETGPDFGVVLTSGKIELVRNAASGAEPGEPKGLGTPREQGPGSLAPATPAVTRAG